LYADGAEPPAAGAQRGTRTGGRRSFTDKKVTDRRWPGILSARTVFGEIFGNEAFRLFCSIAASCEAQGGWENGRIAALVPDSCQGLAPKIARHGADEDKHGRIFNALLRKRGL